MTRSSRLFSGTFALLAIVAAVIVAIWYFGPRGASGVDRSAVLRQYTDIAHAVYADSLTAAKALQRKVDALLADPSPQTLSAARKAWRAARVPYMQSEVFRFGNPPVDAWEGQVNAWPLDEGLIDYVATDYVYEQGNSAGQANLIANPRIQVGSRAVDATELTPDLLADLNEIGGSEANVASGYHAIEFLLWGQDLHGTDAGAGERPASDYLAGPACTDGEASAPAKHCERRRAFLAAATQLLVRDLEYMTAQWAPDGNNNYRAQFLQDLDADEALRRVLFGMGSLALGELAGERMKVALIAHSTEDEHDCFSDNTHNSHYYDALGIANVYHGAYERLDGSLVEGPGIQNLLAAEAPEQAQAFNGRLDAALADVHELVAAAESGTHFDQLIAPGNAKGNARVQQAIDSLAQLAAQIEAAAATLGVRNLNPDTAGHEF